ncbi:uncharacterized protein LOC133315130 [Gastrolobium bilobum]|uniref:uncharacterized protein LOC133315130 n=1 Tax=Gastrolobium bilobum TaxID=150636 RepID=UPI002AAF7C9D|nr:uncharacterized protein LOC133315130 [Gastrolobium bilobum]
MENSEEKGTKKRQNSEEENDFLTLSLSCYRPVRARQIPSPELPQIQHRVSQPLSMQRLLDNLPQTQASPQEQSPFQLPSTLPLFGSTNPPEDFSSLHVRTPRTPTQGPREGKGDTVPVPFPWATDRRATVHSLSYLLEKQIFTITGEVQCKKCERKFELGFDLKEEFAQLWSFISKRKPTMHDRAPSAWMNPVLPTCKYCKQENCVKPIVADKKKKTINWLFLLLGQMLGCCTLEQLKYFCKHTKNHRTGAKDRVLYLTYLGLCKQLDPEGPFGR